MYADISNTLRLEHVRREPGPSARFREEVVRDSKAVRTAPNAANAAALDELRIEAQASMMAGISIF